MILECNLDALIVAKYDLKPGPAVRILFEYEGQFRPMFWFSVGKDGSIYLGPCQEISEAKRMQSTGNLETVIKYHEGEPIKLIGKEQAKISVHASGHIHAMQRQFQLIQPPLRGLKERVFICIVVLKHPNTFKPVTSIRSHDIPIRYPIDKERPFYLYLDAIPQTAETWVRPESARYWMNLLFNCSGLKGVPDITFRLSVSHDSAGPWPPWNYVIFRVANSDQVS